MKNRYKVLRVELFEIKNMLMKIHYAKRLPIIIDSFGLFDIHKNELIGCCTFGTAPSSFWNNGGHLFAKKHQIKVSELNRLVIYGVHEKNLLSFFVSNCINQLEKEVVVISYADIMQNHCGYIYQATNFIYTGLSKPMCKSKDYFFNGKKYNGRTMTSEKIKKIIGKLYDENYSIEENFLNNGGSCVLHSQKHRYIFIKSKNRKKLINDLIFNILPYPKTENKNYKITEKNITLSRLFL